MDNDICKTREHSPHAKGTVLSVWFDFYFHWGIADGLGGVISASRRKGKVVHETVAEFSENRKFTVKDGYVPSAAAYDRIKSQLGAPYNLLECNCEHFVNWAYGLKPESKQVESGLALVGTGIGYKAGGTWQSAAIGGVLGLLLAKVLSNNNQKATNNGKVIVR